MCWRCIEGATAENDTSSLFDGLIRDTAIEVPTVPDVVLALRENRADAGIVYLSTAVAEPSDLEYISFPESIDMRETINNCLTIPATVVNYDDAVAFVRFLLSERGLAILERLGQPRKIPLVMVGKTPGFFNSYVR